MKKEKNIILKFERITDEQNFSAVLCTVFNFGLVQGFLFLYVTSTRKDDIKK
jgi:hypothetical protein